MSDKNFSEYLHASGEVGFVAQVIHSIAYVTGIPYAHPGEKVMFEQGQIGQVLFLGSDYAEVLLLIGGSVHVGDQVARTQEFITCPVGIEVLGKTIDPLGRLLDGNNAQIVTKESRPIDIAPQGIASRAEIKAPFETGISIVDLAVPLGVGQRELVIGDRKTGKTGFVRQVLLTQAKKGTICIYAAIGKLKVDIKGTAEFFAQHHIEGECVLVASAADDPAGLLFLTPYTAMAIAEYFRDQGKNVFVVMDELTSHAKAYREVSLLSKRFPGRSSYPGDIFYAQARLLERGGCFQSGSITVLAIAEAALGDLTGYIQTNLMSMTDGHILFDTDLYGRGRRPPVNPFLSVTRVGLQTQGEMYRDLTRTLTSFLVHLERIRQFVHFGAELSEQVRRELALGDQVYAFLDQPSERVVSSALSAVLFAAVWGEYWKDKDLIALRIELDTIIDKYNENQEFKNSLDLLLDGITTFEGLVKKVKEVAPAMLAIS